LAREHFAAGAAVYSPANEDRKRKLEIPTLPKKNKTYENEEKHTSVT